jgi:type III restriction enzyme
MTSDTQESAPRRGRPRAVRVEQLPEDWLPTQAVDEPILSSPYEEPKAHWQVQDNRRFERMSWRRKAGYFFRTVRVATGQDDLFRSQQEEQLDLVNRLREDVRRWRGDAKKPVHHANRYRGVSPVTKDLFAHWFDPDRPRRLFFCQQEAIETLVYLLELGLPGQLGRTGRKNFEVDAAELRALQNRERAFETTDDFLQRPRLVDPPPDPALLPLLRLGCKMATGSGKTVVMAMLIAWAFCNRAKNPATETFPNAVLVMAPNLTVKKRLQVLRPDHEANYYEAFGLLPTRYRDQLRSGQVLVTNWHGFQPKSEHVEGGTSYRVVEKGEETAEAFARGRLQHLADRVPILVLNDEGHHCWRPRPDAANGPAGKTGAEWKGLSAEEKAALLEDAEEARVWLAGLDRINNSGLAGEGGPGVLAAVDLSATPFYLGASGYPEGSPFPWLVSDFGLLDAIESGIVKIPRLPVRDDSGDRNEMGLPEPRYFRLWRHIQEKLKPVDKVKDRPKPEALYREAQPALATIADGWAKAFRAARERSTAERTIPPVLVVICDNTDLAEIVFRELSGERTVEVLDDKNKPVQQPVYEGGRILPELSNDERHRHTVRIDSKLLASLETDEGQTRDAAAAALRALIDTVGKPGQPGEQVRCIVSVSMLTEGWDASNVTHILGIRAFGSQLLCEQVVGRGLRRMSYDVDPKTQRLLPEYVDVYGIPFSLIPYKAEPRGKTEPEPPAKRIFSVPEKAPYRVEMPIVEGYTYDVRRSGIRCDVDALEGFHVADEPVHVYIAPTRGASLYPAATARPEETVVQTREEFYRATRYQELLFRLAQRITEDLVQGAEGPRAEVLKKSLVARHQVFPDILRIVRAFAERKVTFAKGVDPRELGLVKYANLLRERVLTGILPDAAGPQTLLPILNLKDPVASTDDIDEPTRRPTHPLGKSHLNQAIVLSSWERRAIDILEDMDVVAAFAPNFRRLGFFVPWTYQGDARRYEPDFVVKLHGGPTVLLEIKGGKGLVHGEDEVKAKSAATKQWVAAVNNTGRFGRWVYQYCDDLACLRDALEQHAERSAVILPFRRVEKPTSTQDTRTRVPLVSLRAAAGGWGDEQLDLAQLGPREADEWVAWERPGGFADGMFVARVVGRSMEPDVPDGSYCLFRPYDGGDREGRRLLVWHSGLADPETGGQFTLKVYHREQTAAPDGDWRHTRVVLKPLNPEFEALVLDPRDERDVRVVAELVEVVGPARQAVN